MKHKSLILSILLSVLASLFFIGCDVKEKSADAIQMQQTKKAMSEANRQIGMPAIKNFTERKLMKMILEKRDNPKFICYAYIVNMHGELKFLGKCIGYGLPYSVQYTNPERVVELDREKGRNASGYHFGTLPQPDPNGLFMPEGLSATWLMLIDEKGEPQPVYVEPEILVSPFKLH